MYIFTVILPVKVQIYSMSLQSQAEQLYQAEELYDCKDLNKTYICQKI